MTRFPQVHSASETEGRTTDSFQLPSGSLLLAMVWKPEIRKAGPKQFNVSFQMFCASSVHLLSVVASPFQGPSSPAIWYLKQLHLLLEMYLPRVSSLGPQLPLNLFAV